MDVRVFYGNRVEARVIELYESVCPLVSKSDIKNTYT